MNEALDMLREMAEGTGWEIDDDVSVTCPCGDCIEWDGECPQGCVSIVRQFGFI